MGRLTEHIRDRKLRGFTMPELLVFMIVSGVVFLMVAEGFLLFRRYGDARAAKLVQGSEFYGGYHRLATLAHAADSVAAGYDYSGRIELYSMELLSGTLNLADSLLVLTRGEMKDTLLRRVAALEITRNDSGGAAADTLAVSLETGRGDPLRIGFAITPRKENSLLPDLEEQETKYAYEELPKEQNNRTSVVRQQDKG